MPGSSGDSEDQGKNSDNSKE